MNVHAFIEQQLSGAIPLTFLDIQNESHMHNVPANSQTHFKVTVVSDAFVGQRLIARHRTINDLLADALAGPVHALALHTYTPDEWAARGGVITASPACRGGDARL